MSDKHEERHGAVRRVHQWHGKKTFEHDATEKKVDWDAVKAITGRGAPEPAEMDALRERVKAELAALGLDELSLGDPTTRDRKSGLRERMAAERELPHGGLMAGGEAPRSLTKWAVKCARHGRVCLTHGEYQMGLSDPDNPWRCPLCGSDAIWDDEWYGAMTEDIEVAWEDD